MFHCEVSLHFLLFTLWSHCYHNFLSWMSLSTIALCSWGRRKTWVMEWGLKRGWLVVCCACVCMHVYCFVLCVYAPCAEDSWGLHVKRGEVQFCVCICYICCLQWLNLLWCKYNCVFCVQIPTNPWVLSDAHSCGPYITVYIMSLSCISTPIVAVVWVCAPPLCEECQCAVHMVTCRSHVHTRHAWLYIVYVL